MYSPDWSLSLTLTPGPSLPLRRFAQVLGSRLGAGGPVDSLDTCGGCGQSDLLPVGASDSVRTIQCVLPTSGVEPGISARDTARAPSIRSSPLPASVLRLVLGELSTVVLGQPTPGAPALSGG